MGPSNQACDGRAKRYKTGVRPYFHSHCRDAIAEVEPPAGPAA